VDYLILWIFDCSVYCSVNSQKKNKLESKSKKCIFIGFTKGVKDFRLWDLESRSIFTSRDMVFDDNVAKRIRDRK